MLYDISPRLSPSLAVWPGDAPLAREIGAEIEAGYPTTVSALRATVHLGAHADAPSHYGRGAPAIDELDPPSTSTLPARPPGRCAARRRRPGGPPGVAAAAEAALRDRDLPRSARFREDFAGAVARA